MITEEERAAYEKRIRRAVLRARQRQLDRLLEILGNPPDPAKYDRVPKSLWKELEDDETLLLIPLFAAVAASSAERVAERVGFAEARPEEIAKTYAGQRAAEFAKDAVANTRDALKDLLKKLGARGRQVEAGKATDDRREIADAGLEAIFGESRAESNAITETTAADSGGGRGVVDAAIDGGLDVAMLWVTERDAKVCPICRPLDGKPEDVWGRQFPKGPPAHPRCRCELEYNLSRRNP